MPKPRKKPKPMTPPAPADSALGSPAWKRLIIDGAGRLKVTVTPGHADQFAVHARELLRWNRKINLTSIEEPLDVAIKHYVDAVIPARFIRPDAALLDVGSGGGFPGIPLKIVLPSLSVTLIDATRKKINFLNHAIRMLRLQGIRAQHVRIEDFAKDRRLHRSFDVITCRAFSSLPSFVTGTLPLLKPDGVWIALKGRGAESELNAMTGPAGDPTCLTMEGVKGNRGSLSVESFEYRLPHLDDARSLIVLKRSTDSPLEN